MTTDATEPGHRTPRHEVRERLLAAAADRFAAQGIHGTTLDEVAAAAGFSKGAVYSNFASKDDLVAQLMRESTNAVLESLRTAVRPDVSNDGLPDVIRAAFAPYSDRQHHQFDLLSEFRLHAQRHPEMAADFVRQRQALQEGVRTLTRAWFAAHPEVDPGVDTDTLAVVLVAANVGIAFDHEVLPDVEAGEAIAAVVAGLIRTR